MVLDRLVVHAILRRNLFGSLMIFHIGLYRKPLGQFIWRSLWLFIDLASARLLAYRGQNPRKPKLRTISRLIVARCRSRLAAIWVSSASPLTTR